MAEYVAFVVRPLWSAPESLPLQRCASRPCHRSHNHCSRPFTDSPRKEVYFMAIIDILTHYDAKKKAAHAAKTVKHGVSISALFPSLLLGSCCGLWCGARLWLSPCHQAAQSPSVVLVRWAVVVGARGLEAANANSSRQLSLRFGQVTETQRLVFFVHAGDSHRHMHL